MSERSPHQMVAKAYRTMSEQHCAACGKLLSGLRGSALTCSAACRKKKSREAKKRSTRAAEAFESYAEECSAEMAFVDPARNGEVGPKV